MKRFNFWWVALWTVNVAVMVGLLLLGISAKHFLAVIVPLFLIPEAIGLLRDGDDLPPLTYVIRRYLPQWLVIPTVWTLAAFAIVFWWEPVHARAAVHVAGHSGLTIADVKTAAHERASAVTLIVVFVTGWITTHFETVYDTPEE